MNKFKSFLLAGLLSLTAVGTLASCGPTSDPSTPSGDPSISTPSVDPSVEPSTEPSVEPSVPSFIAPENISLIGTIGEGSDWATDYDLSSSDEGYTWTISDVVMNQGEEWKIRKNHNWGTAGIDNWVMKL